MSRSRDTAFDNGELRRLKHKIGNIAPFVREKEFVVADLDVTQEQRNSIHLLSSVGAVHIDEYELRPKTNDSGSEPKRRWQWDEDKREQLLEYLEQMQGFPCCGERVQIHNPRWAEELACPNCKTEWSKEFVKDKL